MTDKKLTVAYTAQDLRLQAAQLAEKLSLDLAEAETEDDKLLLSDTHLSLCMQQFKPLHVDFQWQTWKKRLQEGKKQALIRALKLKSGMKILDCTAGWGRDAAVMAVFGAEVIMLERDPIMAALLEDGLSRRDEVSSERLKLELIHQDAIVYLNQLAIGSAADVIYIDPMHPERQKRALVKKDMQALQRLIRPTEDLLPLLDIARQKAKCRVVVKWPQKEAPLLPADESIEGKTIRYDIYLP